MRISNKKNIILVNILMMLIFLICISCTVGEKKDLNKNYKLVSIQENLKILSVIDNETEEYETTDPNVFYNTYIGLFGNDSIYIHTLDEDFQRLYTLDMKDNNLSIKYYERGFLTDSLIYHFNKEKLQVNVNSNTYHLTSEYFNYLLNESHNIYSLISLFIPYVEDFSTFDILINKSWFAKNANNNYRITDATIFTKSPHSDMMYKWKVLYNYNQSGNLESVKKIKIEDNSTYLDINLEDLKKDTFIYNIFRIDDGDRFSEMTKLYFNQLNLTDSVYTERQQDGKTITSVNHTFKRMLYDISTINLDVNEIRNIIEKDIDIPLSR